MEGQSTVRLSLAGEYAFDVDFDDPSIPLLRVDEPAPLGGGTGPNAATLLGAAVADCLASSLLFCLRRARIEVLSMSAEAVVTKGRNEEGRLRITGIDVRLQPLLAEADDTRSLRCLGLFEEYCTVTASIRDSIPVTVQVTGVGGVASAVPAEA
jgi:organic hydroperoxide reductase OsmC/OhrA